MKVQMQILLFIICLNLSTGMAIEFNVAGTEYVQPSVPSDVTEYSEHFNATEIVGGWQENIISGIPIIGDIFSMVQTVYRVFSYLIVGFPTFLDAMGDTFIVDAIARDSYNYFVDVLYGIFCVSISILFIEFIAGRYFTE